MFPVYVIVSVGINRKHYFPSVPCKYLPTLLSFLCTESNAFEAARGIGLSVSSDKTEFMCFNQDGAISSLNGKSLKLVDQFIYLSSNISSKKIDTRIRIGKA